MNITRTLHDRRPGVTPTPPHPTRSGASPAAQVRDIMSRNVITVDAADSAVDAAQLLIHHGFTGLPVIDDGHLVGIITEGDLLAGSIGDSEHGDRRGLHQDSATSVGQLMTSPLESLTPGAMVADAARIMVDERIRCLPITDGVTVVGIVTRRDLLRSGITRDDARTADDIRQRLSTLGPSNRWTIVVRTGSVHIEDYVDNADDRARASALALSVPGVVEVDVEHVTCDPF